jgi:UDPglucose--hexose-1-phosphate uridylyltransferase
MTFDIRKHPHRRFNPLTGVYVLVSPHRGERPWLGRQEAPVIDALPAYDPACYLCPGNARATGEVNPPYTGVYAFDNDFPALPQEAFEISGKDALFRVLPAQGVCRVVCYSPDHAATVPELSLNAVKAVVACWRDEAAALERRYPCVQIFENKGEMMGCSNPHPHSQIWATTFTPSEVATEEGRQRQYFEETGRVLLDDVAKGEARSGERVIFETDRFLVVVPFWASWPFETLVIAKTEVVRLSALDDSGLEDLADTIKRLTTRYDNLFGCSFPYSMGFHGAPAGAEARSWRLHAHFYPPLLRSSTIRKFMVGFELLAEAQRDLTPEAAAERLRSASESHYRTGSAR